MLSSEDYPEREHIDDPEVLKGLSDVFDGIVGGVHFQSLNELPDIREVYGAQEDQFGRTSELEFIYEALGDFYKNAQKAFRNPTEGNISALFDSAMQITANFSQYVDIDGSDITVFLNLVRSLDYMLCSRLQSISKKSFTPISEREFEEHKNLLAEEDCDRIDSKTIIKHLFSEVAVKHLEEILETLENKEFHGLFNRARRFGQQGLAASGLALTVASGLWGREKKFNKKKN